MAFFEAKHIAVSYSHGEDTLELFSDVNFALEEGNIYDLIGASGSGKSTLLSILALMLDKTSGELYFKGEASSSFTPGAWRKQVCLVPQVPSLVPGSVYDNLVLPWKLKIRSAETAPSQKELLELLAKAKLSDVELKRDVSQLSGGQIARIALLRAFATKPSVLLLDEVDAALDDESVGAISLLTYELVHEGLSCLRVRHRVSDGFASGTFLLSSGILSFSAPNEAGSL